MEIALYIILGLVVGSVLVWFLNRSQSSPNSDGELGQWRNQVQQLSEEGGRLKEALHIKQEQLDKSEEYLRLERDKSVELSNTVSRQQAEYDALAEKLEQQKEEWSDLQEQFAEQFKNLANELLEDKSKKFTEQNKVNLEGLLKPLGEKLKDFEKRVEETYDKESKQRFTLEKEIQRLYELNQLISKEANNLTSALKSDNKIQGNWGEFVLERVLERSGLEKDIHYRTQYSLRNEEGSLLKPDFVIMLPDDKHIVIDSKVSLTAYEAYMSSEDDHERSRLLKNHVDSFKAHIKGLSEKNYQQLLDINSPDYVFLFVPIEGAFNLAVQSDDKLVYDALEKNIVIVTVSTLVATLATVASIWKQENQKKNVLEIARQSGNMYDKFVGFVDDLIKVGNNLQTTQKNYEEAMKKLHSGRGNLVTSADKIKKLGANASKSLPTSLLSRVEDQGEDD